MKTIKDPISDLELLAGLTKGEDMVIHYLYQKFLPGISSFIRNNSGTETDAMDIFQEALIVIYRKFKREEGELNSSFYTFLFAICRNLWLKELRKRKVRRVTNLEEKESMAEDSEEIDELLLKSDRMQLYRAKFNTLADGCRELLELFFQGLSMRAIAETLGISEKYARKRKFLCKEKLIDSIKTDPVYKELKSDGK